MNPQQLRLAAFHEAGHIWACHRLFIPVTSVALDPAGNASLDAALDNKPARVRSMVAAAGPIAEALLLQANDKAERRQPEPFDDYLASVLWSGGADDAAADVAGFLHTPHVVASLAQDLTASWQALHAAAYLLSDHHAVSGTSLFQAMASLSVVPA